MVITEIKSEYCYMCGKRKAESTHHMIPKTLEPKNNVLVFICHKCHNRINQLDMGAVANHSFRILKELQTLTGMVRDLNKKTNMHIKK